MVSTSLLAAVGDTPHNIFRECIGPCGSRMHWTMWVRPKSVWRRSSPLVVSVHLDRSNVQHLQLHAWRLSSSVWQLHSELVLKLVLVRNDHAHVVCMFVRRALFCFGFDQKMKHHLLPVCSNPRFARKAACVLNILEFTFNDKSIFGWCCIRHQTYNIQYILQCILYM